MFSVNFWKDENKEEKEAENGTIFKTIWANFIPVVGFLIICYDEI